MNSMKKWLLASAAIAMLAACEAAPQNEADSTAGGYTDGGYVADGPNNASGSIAAGTQADLEATAGDRVYFGYDSSVLTAEAQSTLAMQAQWLKNNPGVKAVVEGHCDERGTREYNLALGERRASAARDFLVSQGIASNRLSTISYGKERPAVLGHDASSWAQNRRAVTVVVD